MFRRSLWLGYAVQIAAVVAVSAPAVKAYPKQKPDLEARRLAAALPQGAVQLAALNPSEPQDASPVETATRPLDLKALTIADFGDVDSAH